MKKSILITALLGSLILLFTISGTYGTVNDGITTNAFKFNLFKTNNFLGTTCKDTDGGKAYDIAGIVTIPNKSPYADYCGDPGNSFELIEYSCTDSNKLLAEVYECKYGCKNNACLQTSPFLIRERKSLEKTGCTDTDGERDYYTFGTIQGIDSNENPDSVADTCLSKSQLEEFYCANNEVILHELYTCENGCINGACVLLEYQKVELEPEHMLIIYAGSPNNLEIAAAELEEIHEDEGMIVSIVNVDTIRHFNASDIRDWVSNFKDNNPNLEYLFLFGDTDSIPTFYITSPLVYKDIIETDYYYSLPQNEIPTLYIGRMTPGDLSEANIFVNKVRDYPKSTYQNNILAHSKEEVYYNGYAQTHMDEFSSLGYNTISLLTSYLDQEEIVNTINQGQAFTIYYGHGSSTSIGVLRLNSVISENYFNGGEPTVHLSGACFSGRFEGDPTLGQYMLYKTDGGAVALIAATINGGYGYDYTFVPNFINQCENERIGKVFTQTKINTYIEYYNQQLPEDAYFFMERFTLLGDPAMKICTKSNFANAEKTLAPVEFPSQESVKKPNFFNFFKRKN